MALTVWNLAITVDAFDERLIVDPAEVVVDLLRRTDRHTLVLLCHADKDNLLMKPVECACIYPGMDVAQQLGVDSIFLQIYIVESGNLNLVAGGWGGDSE